MPESHGSSGERLWRMGAKCYSRHHRGVNYVGVHEGKYSKGEDLWCQVESASFLMSRVISQ